MNLFHNNLKTEGSTLESGKQDIPIGPYNRFKPGSRKRSKHNVFRNSFEKSPMNETRMVGSNSQQNRNRKIFSRDSFKQADK